MTPAKWLTAGIVCLVLLIGCAMIGPVMSDVERPYYDVVNADQDIEIRDYALMTIAEVAVVGKRRDAIGDGFRLLADYIFGNNVARQNIAMTAPVQQQSVGDSLWQVSFVMPSQYQIDSLPTPNDERVRLQGVPARRFIVITFSGTSSHRNISKHEKRLVDYIKAHQIEVVGLPKYAFYNPPWTLPFMRRNEIMFEILDDSGSFEGY